MKKDLRSTVFYKKTLGCLMGGLIGDAMGTPTQKKDYWDIEKQFGWVDDFDCDGTDDTVMKNLLSEALVQTDGYATLDDWAKIWLDNWDAIFGEKVSAFFISVLHTAEKVKRLSVPRMAALGNMPSSSSAMCISPVGIVNACNPRQASLQAYNLASLIHIHDVGFCQDGAASMAAAVAEAFKPNATINSIIESAIIYIEKLSGKKMLEAINEALNLAQEKKNYKDFRKAVYNNSGKFFRLIFCDSLETIPIALSLFYIAKGDLQKCVTYGANFGRDSDTIATMCGAIAGALMGVDGIKTKWVEKVNKYASLNQEDLAIKLAQVALIKYKKEREVQKLLEDIS